MGPFSKIYYHMSQLHVQERFRGYFGLNGNILWLQNTDFGICINCKENMESGTRLFLDCSYFRNNVDCLLNKMKLKIAGSNPTYGVPI